MWTHRDILSALNIQEQITDLKFNGISIDTRTLEAGNIFIALPGSERDPSYYTDTAIKQGASFCILPNEAQNLHLDIPCLYSPSTLKALEELAKHARNKAQKTHVIAVTGSAGKTTVKTWLAHILSQFGKTESSRSSYNNHIGVPLSLTQLINEPDYGVFEIGMNHIGEIAPLAHITKPKIAVITSIGAAHIGHMGSLEAIYKEKASIVDGLIANGLAIVPYDEQLLSHCTKASRLATFGNHKQADVQLLSYQENQQGSSIQVSVFGEKKQYQLTFKGAHLAINILIILAVLHELKLSDENIQNLLPLSGRGNLEIWQVAPNFSIQVMNDAYNANPLSMEAGLKAWAAYPHSGRRIAIIGEMRELGAFASKAHQDLKPIIESIGIHSLYTVGKDCLPLSEIWDQTPVVHVDQVENVIDHLKKNLEPNDFIFIKGSNGSRVHQIHKLLEFSISPKN